MAALQRRRACRLARYTGCEGFSELSASDTLEELRAEETLQRPSEDSSDCSTDDEGPDEHEMEELLEQAQPAFAELTFQMISATNSGDRTVLN